MTGEDDGFFTWAGRKGRLGRRFPISLFSFFAPHAPSSKLLLPPHPPPSFSNHLLALYFELGLTKLFLKAFQMSESREDSVYLAKLAEQAERYEGAFSVTSTPSFEPRQRLMSAFSVSATSFLV